jgi:hypothetical protein
MSIESLFVLVHMHYHIYYTAVLDLVALIVLELEDQISYLHGVGIDLVAAGLDMLPCLVLAIISN